MDVSWSNEVNKLCAKRINQLVKEIKNIREENEAVRHLLHEFVKFLDYDGEPDSFTEDLRTYAESNGIDDIDRLFEGELRAIPIYLLGEEHAEVFFQYVKLEALCPYTVGYCRRSQRSPRTEQHLSAVAYTLRSFVVLRATGLEDTELLSCKALIEIAVPIDNWIAARIRMGNRQCIDYIKEGILAENNNKRLNHYHFRAIVKSGNPELLELECKLLVAARLQEGLRQAVIETADEGLAESYIQILRTVKENNLQRFAAVKRGLAAATGLSEQEAPERIDNKFIELVYRYLTDRNEARKALESEDAMQVYLALWATGFYDVSQVVAPIQELIRSAPSYKAEAAMLMLEVTQHDRLKSRLASEALRLRNHDLGIMAGALRTYLSGVDNYLEYYFDGCKQNRKKELSYFFRSRKEAEEDFVLLAGLFEKIGKKKSFSPYVFPWMTVELTQDQIAQKLCDIAGLVNTPELTDKVLEFIPALDSCHRYEYIQKLLQKPTTRKQIEFLVEAMANGSSDVRTEACKIVKRLFKAKKLQDDDFRKMEAHLRLKAAEMRVTVIHILGALPRQKAGDSVRRLLGDKAAPRRMAGLEIIRNWCKTDEQEELVQALLPEVKALLHPTPQEQVIIDAITGSCSDKQADAGYANGFGLYDPNDVPDIQATASPGFVPEKTLGFDSIQEAVELMNKIMNIIEENADYEFKTQWGSVSRIGVCVITQHRSLTDGKQLCLAKPDMWLDFYRQEIKNPETLLKLYALLYTQECDKPFEGLLKQYLGKAFNPNGLKPIKSKKYYQLACDVVRELFFHCGSSGETVWNIIVDLLSDMAVHIEPADLVKEYKAYSWDDKKPHPFYFTNPIATLIHTSTRHWEEYDDELFKRSFSARYQLYRRTGFMKNREMEKPQCPIFPDEFIRARQLGMFTDEQLLHELLGRPYSKDVIAGLTAPTGTTPSFQERLCPNRAWQPADGEEHPVVRTAVEKITEIELRRGDTPTEVSPLAQKLKGVRGIDIYISILVALGKDKPGINIYSKTYSKKEMMSHLLKSSCPDKNDTADELKKRAAAARISEERLVEAAMFSPRWLEITEEALGWNGFTSAAYYFLAHTGETLSDSVKSHVSRYSAVEPEDFADGAFDPDWFHEVYSTLGKERFEVVYRAAKYISDGMRHTRARKLSDAALGNYRPDELMQEIEAKRNRDLVVALGLIPIGKNRQSAIGERYDFLNKFLQESKQFGAQRQASESRAVKLALDNLARTAGYSDSMRLVWDREARMFSQISAFLKPKEIEGVTLYIAIEEGIPDLVIESKGKRLQSLPARIKKEPYVENIKEVYRTLKEQHSRGKALLERSMTDSSEFTGAEIVRLKENPVIWEMLSRLVLVKEGAVFGFPGNDGKSIVSASGEETLLNSKDTWRIAHAYDLYKAGVWSDYQKVLFEREWRQPFKQVFRELYLPTGEEKEDFKSLRYAGNQLMPARTAGVLKKRLWTTDYENGLQKVCFTGQVTAVLYAMADWFSPADIEAPTLEYVAFYDRRSMKEKKIAEVAPVVFSEIMRDVDLAVSVAHAGGVDPETSHSTIEMRSVIVAHSLPMFGIENVEIKGHFAKIKGQLGDYSIHFGSGVIHREGGAQIAVLPVHSQSRGRIFLPFLDEDPKTAEILSKILLFAEDSKIKDPSILSQID